MSDIITLVSSFMSAVLLQPIDSVAVPLLISTQNNISGLLAGGIVMAGGAAHEMLSVLSIIL